MRELVTDNRLPYSKDRQYISHANIARELDIVKYENIDAPTCCLCHIHCAL